MLYTFFKRYMTRPRTVGAIMPSSKKLAARMVSNIDFSKAQCVVEFGPGTGAITRELIHQRKHHQTVLVLIELDPVFCNALRKRHQREKNLIIVNDSAAHIEAILKNNGFDQADYIVSGLPLTTLPGEIARSILAATRKTLRDHGVFILFQYTLLKRTLLMQYFSPTMVSRVLWNVPPAYVIVMKPSHRDVH